MTLIAHTGVASTCGHPQTGSKKVTVFGKGVSRVGSDFAGGSILGPGVPKVTVEGFVVSVAGDSIAPHGKNKHKYSKTVSTQTKVSAG